MSTPASRPTTARLLVVGDTISVSTPSGERCWVTITAVDDDESNRLIRITVRDDGTGRVGDIDASPGDKFDRQALVDDLRESVMVTSTIRTPTSGSESLTCGLLGIRRTAAKSWRLSLQTVR